MGRLRKFHIFCMNMKENKEIKELFDEVIKKAESEREIYRKVKARMENEGSDTLCLSSEYSKKKNRK